MVLISVLSFILMSVKLGHPLSVLLPLAQHGKDGKPVKNGNMQSSSGKLLQVLVSWAVYVVLQWEDTSYYLQEQISSLLFQNECLWFFCSPSAFTNWGMWHCRLKLAVLPRYRYCRQEWWETNKMFTSQKKIQWRFTFPRDNFYSHNSSKNFTRNLQSDTVTSDIPRWRVKIL